jgi:mono/diheme cytochrome c family protein
MTGPRPMIIVAAALWLALGCAGGSAGEPKERPSGVGGAPAGAAALRNPYDGDREATGAGRKLYTMHCASCHGERGEGWGNAPSLMSDAVRRAPPGAVFWFLTNGDLRRGMPAWSRLSEPRRWQLVAFLDSLKSDEK